MIHKLSALFLILGSACPVFAASHSDEGEKVKSLAMSCFVINPNAYKSVMGHVASANLTVSLVDNKHVAHLIVFRKSDESPEQPLVPRDYEISEISKLTMNKEKLAADKYQAIETFNASWTSKKTFFNIDHFPAGTMVLEKDFIYDVSCEVKEIQLESAASAPQDGVVPPTKTE